MKKLFAKICAAALAVVACVTCFTGCNNKTIKVMKDIALTAEEYAFAIKKDNTDLLNSVNACIAEWKEDGSLLLTLVFGGDSMEFNFEFLSDDVTMQLCRPGTDVVHTWIRK